LSGQRRALADLPSSKKLVPILHEPGCNPGPVGQVQKSKHPRGFEPRTDQPVMSRYTDYSIPAPIWYLWPLKCRRVINLQYVCHSAT